MRREETWPSTVPVYHDQKDTEKGEDSASLFYRWGNSLHAHRLSTATNLYITESRELLSISPTLGVSLGP